MTIGHSHPRANILVQYFHQFFSPKIKNILDIGAHDGSLVDQLPKGLNIHTLEASAALHKVLTKKGYKNKNIFWKDGDKLPYKDNQFDVVILGEVIEHIFNTDNAIKEIARITRPGGYFLISTPNIASFGRRILLLLGKNPLLETRTISENPLHNFNVAGHIRYFTFDTLKELLHIYKFKVLEEKSDILNFANSDKYSSAKLAKIFPKLGRSIIFLAKKSK